MPSLLATTAGKRRVGIAQDQDSVRTQRHQLVIARGKNTAGLTREIGLLHAQIIVRSAQLQFFEENIGERRGAVLAGMDQSVIADFVQLGNNSRETDNFRARAQNCYDFHRYVFSRASLPRRRRGPSRARAQPKDPRCPPHSTARRRRSTATDPSHGKTQRAPVQAASAR